MDAENTFQVFDWLWTSGQLSERDIALLPSLGIEVVVNLALPTSSPCLPDECDLVTRLGLAYVQIPVEWDDPRPEQFRQFAGVLQAFSGRRIWVHCARNMRVSVFVSLYRRHLLGEDAAQADFQLNAIWHPNPLWQSFIAQVDQLYATSGQQAPPIPTRPTA